MRRVFPTYEKQKDPFKIEHGVLKHGPWAHKQQGGKNANACQCLEKIPLYSEFLPYRLLAIGGVQSR